MKIDVLDKGFIELVDKLGNDLTVVNAARCSFGKRKYEWDSKDERLVKYLAKHQHTSPFRHVMIQLHIKFPMFVARQWFKHIVGSEYQYKDTAWNEVSYRYVEAQEEEFYVPEIWRKQSKSSKQASSGVLDKEEQDIISNIYKETVDIQLKSYYTLLENGVAREMARGILPQSMYTEVWWTASLQCIINFIKLRNHEGAQWEIQEYAKALEKIVMQICPVSAESLLSF